MFKIYKLSGFSALLMILLIIIILAIIGTIFLPILIGIILLGLIYLGYRRFKKSIKEFIKNLKKKKIKITFDKLTLIINY